MSYRSDYINQNKGATQQRIAQQQAANTNITNQYIQDINAIIDQTTKNAVNKVQGEIDKLPTAYQSTFDANAVQQKINERQLKARMSDLGLTDSGLNRTQQTALAIQRSNADASARQQMNAASLSLKQQIADLYADAETRKAEQEATARYDLAKQNQSIYNTMMDNLYSNADSYASSQIKADNSYNSSYKYLDSETQKEIKKIYNSGDEGAFNDYMNYLVSQGYDANRLYEFSNQLAQEEIENEERLKTERINKAKSILAAYNKFAKDYGLTKISYDDTNAVKLVESVIATIKNDNRSKNDEKMKKLIAAWEG